MIDKKYFFRFEHKREINKISIPDLHTRRKEKADGGVFRGWNVVILIENSTHRAKLTKQIQIGILYLHYYTYLKRKLKLSKLMYKYTKKNSCFSTCIILHFIFSPCFCLFLTQHALILTLILVLQIYKHKRRRCLHKMDSQTFSGCYSVRYCKEINPWMQLTSINFFIGNSLLK